MSRDDRELREDVLKQLAQNKAKPLNQSELAVGLGMRGKERKRLQKVLHDLMMGGEVVQIRSDRFALGAEADLVSGKLSVSRSGRGFVASAAKEADLVVESQDLGTALPGDIVLVRLNREPSGRPGVRQTGKVIRIMERARHDIVGTLRSTSRFTFVVPLDPVYRQNFYVKDAKGGAENDRVVVRFTEWLNRHVSPEGEILEVLGPADNPTLDTRVVLKQFGYDETFPEEVIREAETVSRLAETPGPREDLRDRLILTIDPARARDFDDALSLDRDGQGRLVLGVHIADVCHYVLPGSALDREAQKRGNSVYFPDRVIPMLPEQLSNGVCSLNPNVDRLAFSVFMTLDEAGAVVGRRFCRSIIRSKHRLTYEQVMALLEQSARAKGGKERGRAGKEESLPADAITLLKRLDELAQGFRQRRMRKDALDLDMPECEVVIGHDGRIEGLRIVPNDRSHQLVEECMVAANEAVAMELAQHSIPLISRLHEDPSEDKIEALTAELKTMGYKPGDLSNRHNLASFLKAVEKDPLGPHARMAVLRSLKRALYSANGRGHFGLAKMFYAHFTSPIRRYPDLTVHRQLATLIAGGKGHRYTQERLAVLAESCTQTEWRADEAERQLMEIKKFRFMEETLAAGGERTFDAVVVSVVNFGLFVELTGYQIQGLVHISALSEKFVRFSEEKGALTAGKRVFRRGQTLKVRVAKVDTDARKLDFVPA